MAQNYYLILGVTCEATLDEIKAAYRHRVQMLHPDHYGANREPFLKLQEAYGVLSDPRKRRSYDEQNSRREEPAAAYEAEPMRQRAFAEPMRARSMPSADLGAISVLESFHTYAPSFDELFDRFWGNFDTLTRPKAETVQSLDLEVPISPEQARGGGRVRVLLPARADCPTCRGDGRVAAYECWRCAGHGSITADYPLDIRFPAGVANQHTVQVPLRELGIGNFFLTVRFRVTLAEC